MTGKDDVGRWKRYLDDGTVDPAFAEGNGVPLVYRGPGHIHTHVEQPDGKILVRGRFHRIGDVERLGCARLHADGSLDLTFQPAALRWTRVNSLTLLPSGQILVIHDNELLRLLPTGQIDDSYVGLQSMIRLFVQNDGAAYGTHYRAENQTSLVRLFPSGEVDGSFSTTLENCQIANVIGTGDGKVIAVGTEREGQATRAIVYVMSPNGQLLRRFASDPRVGGQTRHASANHVVSQADGHLVLAGDFDAWGGLPRSGVVALLSDGRVDPSFGPNWGTPGVGYVQAADDGAVQFTSRSTISDRRVYGQMFEGMLETWGDRASPSAPRVALAQSTMTRPIGGDLTLLAEVTGYPAPDMQWEKDGLPLANENSQRLVIRPIIQASAGTYRLRVRCSEGEALSDPVQLSIGANDRALQALSKAARGPIIKGNRPRIANASICAFDRGDGFDDLILAEWASIKGLVHLVNSKDPDQPWREELLEGAPPTSAHRRIAVGKLDDDALPDLIELRLSTKQDENVSAHWYQGQEKEGVRSLIYKGSVDLEDPPYAVAVDVRLRDIDGDGDSDAMIRHIPSFWGHFIERTGPPQLVWWRNDGVDKPWPKHTIGDLSSSNGLSVFGEGDDDLSPTDFHMEDLDLDGDDDVAIVDLTRVVTKTWFENQNGQFTRRGPDPKVAGLRPVNEALGPPVFGAERPGLIGFHEARWSGRVVGWANVNGDGMPDRILAVPGCDDDDDDGPNWKRGLWWERGEKTKPLGVKGGFVLLPLLLWRRRSRRGL